MSGGETSAGMGYEVERSVRDLEIRIEIIQSLYVRGLGASFP